MLLRLPGLAAPRLPFLLLPVFLPLLLSLPTHAAPRPQADDSARVSALYTTWDDYYFYAAFRVTDTDVIGTNTSTTSQPQQDDDVEVFFETDDARAKVRTPQTFQMAVSAAQGAYFSVGDGTRTPQGKAVYSYKYAVTVHGTLNKGAGADKGYDVELAIPWTELGRAVPPKDGDQWGFNVISRDRQSLTQPADRFYSLSPRVRKREDVQEPARWSRIVFVSSGAVTSTEDKVICARVSGAFPRINGTVVSGDWPAATRLAFGTEAITAPAPTVAEEPNTTQSPFDNPAALTAPEPTPGPQANVPTGYIDLPNGGSIKIVPGGIQHPQGMEVPVPRPPAPKPAKGGKPYQVAQVPATPDGVTINSAAFTLGQPRPPAYIMAIYRLDFNGDGRKGPPQNVWGEGGRSLLAEQPMNGAGPWFSGLRPQWHRQQLEDLRRSGIEVALLRTRPDDPQLGRELDAFVQALKEMKAQDEDYPLVGVDATAGRPDLDVVYAHLPAEFRAMQAVPGKGVAGVLVYDLTLGTDDKPALADGTPIARAFYNSGVASVSPGRLDKSGLVDRKGGLTYDTSWQVALVSTPDQIVVESWNDFAHGTEIAASRQYGEQYADATRAEALQFDGGRPWHAKYLAETAPRTVFPKTLYQVPIRIENGGTLPWRAGEGYALCYRWYRDGKLFDDSAPRIPVSKDVLPGQALILSVGLVARDNFGEDLEPGDYTLVFDMVQGQERWFSYAGDVPLQVPVSVIGADAGIGGTSAVFLGTRTPGVGLAGADLPTTVQVRNDGASAWPVGYALGYKIQKTDPDGANPQTLADGSAPLGPDPVVPGQIAIVSLPVPLAGSPGKPLEAGTYRLHWFVKPDALGAPVNGGYDETVSVADSLPGASFVLSDLPRTVEAGKEATASLALQNLGAGPLKKSATRIGYHWYYLDGTEREWEGGPLAYLSKDVPPGGVDGAISATFQTPKEPGRYALVWDVRQGDGPWQSTLPASLGDDALQVLVNVGGKGSAVPVDLTKSFNTVGIASSAVSKTSGFDGRGATLPGDSVPPDATSEIDADPLLVGKPGPPLYPSGYYAGQTGADAASNHAVPFLYPAVLAGRPNVVACAGQTLSLPGGKYRAIHLLAASSAPVPPADFELGYDRDTQPVSLQVQTWDGPQTGADVSPALSVPYRHTPAGVKAAPCTLGDYTLRPDPSRKLTGLTLPNTPGIKIVAVTLVKE